MIKTAHTLEYVKRKAKNLKKSSTFTHVEALEIVAKELGFKNYKDCLEKIRKND